MGGNGSSRIDYVAIPDSVMKLIVQCEARRRTAHNYRASPFILDHIVVSARLHAPMPTGPAYGHTHFKHALEWNYFIGVVLFYFLSFLFWKKKGKA